MALPGEAQGSGGDPLRTLVGQNFEGISVEKWVPQSLLASPLSYSTDAFLLIKLEPLAEADPSNCNTGKRTLQLTERGLEIYQGVMGQSAALWLTKV